MQQKVFVKFIFSLFIFRYIISTIPKKTVGNPIKITKLFRGIPAKLLRKKTKLAWVLDLQCVTDKMCVFLKNKIDFIPPLLVRNWLSLVVSCWLPANGSQLYTFLADANKAKGGDTG